VQKIAIRSSKRMFETLPVKSGVHDADYQAVAGAVKFGMLSFLQDLRPMLRTQMNATLRLDAAEAAAESPALLQPVAGARLTAWVGAAEAATAGGVGQDAVPASSPWENPAAEPDAQAYDQGGYGNDAGAHDDGGYEDENY
jgi:hypothetical protein